MRLAPAARSHEQSQYRWEYGRAAIQRGYTRPMIGNLKRELAVQWSLWRHAKFAIGNTLCSGVCYSVGWHLSSSENAMPLARAGALATAFAIAFTLYDYRRALRQSEDQANQTFAKVTKQLPFAGAASQERVEAITRRNTELVEGVVTIWQAVLLIGATLVWGFGDLATALF